MVRIAPIKGDLIAQHILHNFKQHDFIPRIDSIIQEYTPDIYISPKIRSQRVKNANTVLRKYNLNLRYISKEKNYQLVPLAEIQAIHVQNDREGRINRIRPYLPQDSLVETLYKELNQVKQDIAAVLRHQQIMAASLTTFNESKNELDRIAEKYKEKPGLPLLDSNLH